jgi:hypothetical protein
MKANGLVKGTQSKEHPFYLSKKNKQDECRMVFTTQVYPWRQTIRHHVPFQWYV